MNELIQQVIAIASNEWVRNIFWAVVLAVATAVVSHLVKKALKALLNRDDVPLPSSSIIINIARAIIWVIGGSIILDSCFGINPNAVITALGVGGIAVSLGFQDTLSNLIGGIQMTFMKIVEPGDNIEVGGDIGVVQDVTWRHTTIRTKAGELVVIPNSVISKNALVKLPPATQLKVPFAVTNSNRSMDEIAEALASTSKAAAEEVSPVTQDPQVFFSEITEYGFKGSIIMRIEDADKTGSVTDAVVRAIAHETR
ncbi:mechanosensitive ion channel protein MscS [Slackia equolifaciens]|uniref:Mechanosensitive ion channel protein MscS n=1 Tax=Slackia equolifaciens TaxID=498718 RepID=A0A3N0B545_9ACTN|nr:mechanosensitive ion channel domain-containing protein [Slackia equolifaciens]RNL42098.1 mechanosensitive ion channel protein MscS [Slackia equolifaciens]